ncbi:MAG: S8 family serine peptidase [Ignavibacteria bacterium]
MKTTSYSYILIIIFAFSFNVIAKAQQNYHPERIIIKFKSGSQIFSQLKSLVPKTPSGSYFTENKRTDQPALNKFFSYFKIRSIRAVMPDATTGSLAGGVERIFIAEINDGDFLNSVITSLQSSPYIEYAEKDFKGEGSGKKVECSSLEKNNSSIIPNDPMFNLQWGLRNTGQTVNGSVGIPGADINITNGWNVSTGVESIKLAILDSGIPPGASEFSGRILDGYDYANNDNDPTDDQGHGTNVTSIAAAKGNNNSLVAGMNWNCKIIPVKILDANNSGFYTWWISGITFAISNGAKVLNMSVGGSSYSQALADAVTFAYSSGAVVVVSMMNNNNNIPYYPAAFDNVIAIGAMNNRNNRAVPFCWGGGSSYGSHIDFIAPGDMILGLDAFNPTLTNYWCGTSQATPMVSGLISLMFGVNNTLTFEQVYQKIKEYAVDQIGPPSEDSLGFDSYFGWGRVNAEATLNAVNVSVGNYSTSIPETFSLHQNFPNPFNPTTKIRFDIVRSDFTTIIIYDVLGKEVKKLVNEFLTPGSYEVVLNATDYPSGTYHYMVSSGSFIETKSMIVLK